MEKQRILIADQEKAVRTLLAEVLGAHDIHMDLIENGNEVLTQMDKRSYDLIILDYMMPDMDGLELIRRIRSKQLSVPLLIVTSDGPIPDLLRYGVSAWLQKPFDIFELQTVVNGILNGKTESNS